MRQTKNIISTNIYMFYKRTRSENRKYFAIPDQLICRIAYAFNFSFIWYIECNTCIIPNKWHTHTNRINLIRLFEMNQMNTIHKWLCCYYFNKNIIHLSERFINILVGHWQIYFSLLLFPWDLFVSNSSLFRFLTNWNIQIAFCFFFSF